MKLERYFQYIIMLFWTGWFSLAGLTNIMDFLKECNILGVKWNWASGNLKLIRQSTEIFNISETTNWIIFSMVVIAFIIIIQTYILYWFYIITKNAKATAIAQLSMFFSLGYIMLLMIADELLLVYNFESKHLALLSALLLSKIVLTGYHNSANLK